MSFTIKSRRFLIKVGKAKEVNLTYLTPDEFNHVKGYLNSSRLNESLMGIHIAKYLISNEYLVKRDCVEIKWLEDGSPYAEVKINGITRSIFLSISHSNNYVAVIIPKMNYSKKLNYGVGVDIESIVEVVPTSIARRFSTIEQMYLSKCIYKNKELLFTYIWTRKESIFKATDKSFTDVLSLNSIHSDINVSTFYIKNYNLVISWAYK